MKLAINFKKATGATLLIGAFLLALGGCDTQDGPAEKAGEKVDNASENLGEKIEDTGEAIQDKANGDPK